MAELADALDSGSSEVTFVQVQVLLPAPKNGDGHSSISIFLFGLRLRRTCPTPQALVAGNVCRFAAQMTDLVRQDKLAGEQSEPCSSVLLPAPNNKG